jgi:hypothetical protein
MTNNKITAKRISDAAIVGTGPTVIYDDDPDLFLYDLSKVVIKKRGFASTENYISVPPTSSGGVLSQFANQAGVILPEESFQNLIEGINTVDLSYIENVTGSSYDDSLGNKKVKYLIKIRNSSLNRSNIVGVDARIYNPFA